MNRYGFPSQGHALLLSRLKKRIPWFQKDDEVVSASFRPESILAVNLGKNKFGKNALNMAYHYQSYIKALVEGYHQNGIIKYMKMSSFVINITILDGII